MVWKCAILPIIFWRTICRRIGRSLRRTFVLCIIRRHDRLILKKKFIDRRVMMVEYRKKGEDCDLWCDVRQKRLESIPDDQLTPRQRSFLEIGARLKEHKIPQDWYPEEVYQLLKKIGCGQTSKVIMSQRLIINWWQSK